MMSSFCCALYACADEVNRKKHIVVILLIIVIIILMINELIIIIIIAITGILINIILSPFLLAAMQLTRNVQVNFLFFF